MSDVIGVPGWDIPLTPFQVPTPGWMTQAEMPLKLLAVLKLSTVFCSLPARTGSKVCAFEKLPNPIRASAMKMILVIKPALFLCLDAEHRERFNPRLLDIGVTLN
jgi:hypothetical protein